MSVRRVSSVLLVASVALMAVAWQVQADAAAKLALARRIQGAEVGDEAASPPNLDDYRAVVGTLQESIEIRTGIDGMLGEVEEIVLAMQQSQAGAADVSQTASEQLSLIAASLGGSVGAARDAIEGLRRLGDELVDSERLARLIALELEELDESMGP